MSVRSRRMLVAAALLPVACATVPVTSPDARREELFAVERSFALASTERGIRASFLEYFAPDGIDFRPGPGSMRARMLARPVPDDPLALLLDWSPQAGAVSRADDIGFTAGPYSLRNQRVAGASTSYGYYLSVWTRESGMWRVALDAGVSTPAAPAPDSLRSPAPADVSKAELPIALRSDRGRDALFALERVPRSLDPDADGSASYFDLLATSVCLLREGRYAVLGADAVRRAHAAPGQRVSWTPAGGGVAASDDLGYTYGRYAQLKGSGEGATGYYVHVWQRDGTGQWRIAAEVLLPPA